MNLQGTVTLITGGGTGLGKEIALQIAREGGDVAVNYSRSREDAEATVGELRALGVRAATIAGDVSKSAEAERIVSDTVATFGRLDVLVNNAGTTRALPFKDLEGVTEEDWDRIMAVNVKGAFFVARAAARVMPDGGRILNTTSIGGIQPYSSALVYSCSKAAMIMLTRSLAVALAPKILVNGTAPGLLATRWAGAFTPEMFERASNATLSKRIPTVEDTAAMAVALIKNDSMTGQVVNIDGGTILY